VLIIVWRGPPFRRFCDIARRSMMQLSITAEGAPYPIVSVINLCRKSIKQRKDMFS
jgi:hypothetical protein